MTAPYQPRRLAKSAPWPTVLACVILFASIALAFALGSMLATARTEDKPPLTVATPTSTAAPVPSAAPAETPEPVRHRDDIVSDGRLLAYDLQDIMQDACEVYGVPYALALAIAEVETHFDPDAVSPTHDYGLMQINQINHAWLLEKGFDVHTYAGNIEAGLYIIGGYLDTYGDTERALMAYNNGPNGAKKLWDAGTYQTDYTRKVMAALEHWTSGLEA